MTEHQSGHGLTAKCPCGASEVTLAKMPSVRFLCHCTICQSVYPGDYADATAIRADMVEVNTPDSMTFSKLKEPPALDRGVCKSCNHPVVGFLKGPGAPEFAFVPSAVLPKEALLPKPLRHVYYDTRVADVDDDLPKTSGGFKSILYLLLPFLSVARGH